jgi:hypothetical protein
MEMVDGSEKGGSGKLSVSVLICLSKSLFKALKDRKWYGNVVSAERLDNA